ncbi:related to polygalacturonase 1 precursor [Phialocephala subalpina]|uniref:Related to polygalacturonase 1 n=1 Tax=Phialocephala subalpina TaxID=576137 RepID=A0A1L7X9P9_9HELO|nr:related to polygalacturonase 1 precursor [Phialocephala subalpina]
MMQFTLLAVILGLSTSRMALALVPDQTHELAGRAICTPTSGGSPATDDTPAIAAAIQSCGAGGTIVIPPGRTYYFNTQLAFAGCANCDFQLEGTLKFTSSTSYWNGKKYMIYIQAITKARFRSLTGTGLIDGNGQDSYDFFATDNTYKRPTGMRISGSTGVTVSGFKVKNTPSGWLSVEGGSVDTSISNIGFSAVSKSSNRAKNTDGYDIGKSTYTTLSNLAVNNDDDCVAFKPGANYVSIDTISCNGSHGISVGSLGGTLGQTDSVTNIYVKNAAMSNSAKSAGIKIWPGQYGSAIVRNVTWDTVTVDNDGYTAEIQQCCGVSASSSDCLGNPSPASITDVYFKNFKGTTSTKYEPVVANLNCPGSGTCDIYFSNFAVNPPTGTAKFLCANVDSTPGITCSSGANS